MCVGNDDLYKIERVYYRGTLYHNWKKGEIVSSKMRGSGRELYMLVPTQMKIT